jgi:hypothetical protein
MARKHNPNFFAREPDGSVRIRVRFDSDEAALFEEAAGDMPVMAWLHRTLAKAAREEVREARRQQPQVPPPREAG